MNREYAASIAVADNDPTVRKILRRWLEAEGYQVNDAGNGADLKKCFSEGAIDLLILDIGLLGVGGLAFVQEIRAVSDIGIIIVSARSKAIDKVVGLEVGADDYIAKPFNPREVIARVRSILRRSKLREQRTSTGAHVSHDPHYDTYSFEGWMLDVARRKLLKPDGVECLLTTAEFDLMKMFVEHPQRVLTRDEIMDLMHGREWSPYDRTIDNQIARLRKKIEPDPTTPEILRTVRGSGYSFTAHVACA